MESKAPKDKKNTKKDKKTEKEVVPEEQKGQALEDLSAEPSGLVE